MKKLLSLLLIIALLLSVFPMMAASAESTARARTDFNIRAEMDTDSGIVCNVRKGQSVTILAYGENWCAVKLYSYQGYAKTSWFVDAAAVRTLVPSLDEYMANNGIQTTSVITLLGTETDLSADLGPSVYDTLFNYGTDSNILPVFDVEARKSVSLRKEPDESSYKLCTVKKKQHLLIMAWGDVWSKAQTLDGRYTGYIKTQYLYHYHTYDPFLYPVPGWEPYHSDGYIVMTQEETIRASNGLFGNFNLQVGDTITVQKRDDVTHSILLLKELVDIPASSAEYVPFVNWREAKAGDIIGGGSQFFGQRQGGAYYGNRKKNIALAISFMDGSIIKSGEEYSFLTDIGPVTPKTGYLKANVTGGAGSGTGGGTCHTSTLMYESVLSLPFLVTEREPHTMDGNNYAPLEFDATVGAYSDFQFVNTLPYDIQMHAYIDKLSGSITVLFECLETVEPDILATWDGTAAKVRTYEYHR